MVENFSTIRPNGENPAGFSRHSTWSSAWQTSRDLKSAGILYRSGTMTVHAEAFLPILLTSWSRLFWTAFSN